MPVTKFGLPEHPDETFVLTKAANDSGPAAHRPPAGPSAVDDDETRTVAVMPRAPVEASAPDDADAATGYRLLRQIGQGGVGEVWEAEQGSLGRVVAVKRMRRAEDRRAGPVQDEFRRESLIAGSLEHPNILPIYDLGRGADGEWLLAMKRVHGRPWKDLLRADFNDMSVDAFLTRHVPTLIAVSQAVAFAHSRGFIHRDIKPAQVMVGAFGEVLLTDWGLAIAVGAEQSTVRPLRDAPTLATATNPAGTPSLMAPEQTENHGGNLGPWTDVYLLGGTLYYLLTGSYPHSADSSDAAFDIARAGGRVQPPGVRAAGRQVPPELEQLCLAALEPEPARRVASAEAFLKQLQDYLSGAARKEKSAGVTAGVASRMDAGEPDYATCTAALASLDEARRLWPDNPEVSPLRQRALRASAELALQQGDLGFARLQCDALEPDEQSAALQRTITARQKQVARRKLLLRTATGIACALLVVIAVGALLFSHKMQTANREIAQREQAAEHALAIARARGSGAFGLINYVLNDLRTAMDQELTPERGITVDMRDEIAHAIAGKVATPVVAYFTQADSTSWPREMQIEQIRQIRETGAHFREMGRFDEAVKLLRPDLAHAEKLLGPNDKDVAKVAGELGLVYRYRNDDAKAEPLFRRALSIAEAQYPPDAPERGVALANMAEMYRKKETKASLEKSEAMYRRAVAIFEKHPDQQLPATLASLGDVLTVENKLKQAEAVQRRALDLSEQMAGPDSPGLATRIFKLAETVDLEERFADAEALYRRALAVAEKTLGPDHPQVAQIVNALSLMILYDKKDLTPEREKDAESMLLRQKAIVTKVFGPQSVDMANSLQSLAVLYGHQHRYRKSEAATRQALAIFEAKYGDNHRTVAVSLSQLGRVLILTHRLDQADKVLHRSLDILKKTLGPDNYDTVSVQKMIDEVKDLRAKEKKQ